MTVPGMVVFVTCFTFVKTIDTDCFDVLKRECCLHKIAPCLIMYFIFFLSIFSGILAMTCADDSLFI
jgi:hypothetical protein